MTRFARVLDLPYLLLAFAPLCWAGNVVVGRAVRGEIPPLSLNWWRWSLAATIFLVFVHRVVWRERHLLLKHWRLLLLLSFIGLTAFHSALYIGLQHTTAINAALIVGMGPVLIVPLAWALLGERLTALQGLGVVLSCIGAVVVVTRADMDVLLGLRFNRGDLWMLFGSACWAIYSVLLKLKPPALGVTPMLAAILLLAAILTTPLYLWELSQGRTIAVSTGTIAALGYVSVFAGVLAYIAWNRGVHLVGPNKAGLFLHLIPAYGAVLAAAFLGERLEVYHLAGFAFIVVGIVLTTRFGPKAQSTATVETR